MARCGQSDDKQLSKVHHMPCRSAISQRSSPSDDKGAEVEAAAAAHAGDVAKVIRQHLHVDMSELLDLIFSTMPCLQNPLH